MKSRGEDMKNLVLESLYIETTQSNRTLRVLLPEGYNESKVNYPVLYMHDGQNCFEDETSFSGHSWGFVQIIKDLKKKGLIEDLIVVGIDNSDLRLFEYSPWENKNDIVKYEKLKVGGMGELYADFVVNQVKPFIDKNYRTLTDYQSSSIAGSSMGAYISCYIAAKYPDIFQNVGVFSLSSWFNEGDFLSFIRQANLRSDQRYFISIGDCESSDPKTPKFNEIYLNNSRNLKKLLFEKNIMDLCFIETHDIHNELAWRKVLPSFLLWLNKRSK
jgi:predicted alpha/beta superfamily hydrolase